MALSRHSSSCFLVVFFFFLHLHLGTSTEFQVGEIRGWVVPPANQTDFYNQWASHKRFLVGDTIRFSYGKKDSVMEVSKRDYEECNSTRPSYFSNVGDTLYGLNRSAFFYFISGTAGHCHKGQRMVVWVLGTQLQDDHQYHHPSSSCSTNSLHAALVLIIILAAAAALQSTSSTS